MIFIDLQNFGKFRQKLADFWPKNQFFFADSAKYQKSTFALKGIGGVEGKKIFIDTTISI